MGTRHEYIHIALSNYQVYETLIISSYECSVWGEGVYCFFIAEYGQIQQDKKKTHTNCKMKYGHCSFSKHLMVA